MPQKNHGDRPSGPGKKRKRTAGEPHWEHGYRCHGYWLGDLRLGRVSRPPGRKAPDYGWFIDGTKEEGRCKTLREAKRIVEAKAL